MEIEVTPEPPEDVRAAIRGALRRAERPPESAWWRAGVEEAVRDAPRVDQTAARRPRSSPGADRA